MTSPAQEAFGVYVHWPFCLSKCPYCDFNSHVRHAPIDESRFASAFAREIETTAARAPTNTSAVKDRRPVHFENLDDIVADAEMLVAAKQLRTLGNWTLGQALGHLAISMNGAIDGVPIKPWFIMRLLGRLMKKRFLRGPMPAGFKLPKAAEAKMVPPPQLSAAEGLEKLRSAVARLQREPTRSASPFLGNLTREEADRLQLRHSELHLSFFWPVDA